MSALITANLEPGVLSRLRELLGDLAVEPWGETGEILQGDEMAEKVRAGGYAHLVVEVDILHEDFWDALGDHPLRTVSVCRADPITVDLEAASRRGVPVFYAPARNAQAVAELTIGMMIAFARRLVFAHGLLRSGKFEPASPKDFMKTYGALTGFEIGTRTVGVVGLGAIGRMVAERLRPFGCRLLGCDPYADAARLGVEAVDLGTLLRESDLVTLHCALTEETRGLLGAAELALLKPTAVLLNLARADVVDGDALYAALAEGRIAGACLDVFHQEPVLPDDRFLTLDNVLVTPHIGGATVDVPVHQSRMILAALEGWAAGAPPPGLLANPEALSSGGGRA